MLFFFWLWASCIINGDSGQKGGTPCRFICPAQGWVQIYWFFFIELVFFNWNYGIVGPNFIEINIIVLQENIAIFIALPIIAVGMDIGNIGGICFVDWGTFWESHLKGTTFLHFVGRFDIFWMHHHHPKKAYNTTVLQNYCHENAILTMHAYTHCKVSPKLQNTAIVVAQPNIAIIIEIWLAIEIIIFRW